MPNYTLAQLRAMQAERRYWDTRDPENADFVAQVDQGYRDLFDEPAALVPTPEQEEQSRRQVHRLSRLSAGRSSRRTPSLVGTANIAAIIPGSISRPMTVTSCAFSMSRRLTV